MAAVQRHLSPTGPATQSALQAHDPSPGTSPVCWTPHYPGPPTQVISQASRSDPPVTLHWTAPRAAPRLLPYGRTPLQPCLGTPDPFVRPGILCLHPFMWPGGFGCPGKHCLTSASHCEALTHTLYITGGCLEQGHATPYHPTHLALASSALCWLAQFVLVQVPTTFLQVLNTFLLFMYAAPWR